MDIMVRQVLGVSSLLLFFLLSCHKEPKETRVLKVYDITKIKLSDRNGQAFLGNQLFSGKLFALNTNKDTVYKATYLNGVKEGVEIKCYVSGKINEKRRFKNGFQNGTAKGWYESGKPMFVYQFKNEAFHGVYKEWYENGKLYRDQHFVNGLEEGVQQVYNSDGRIKVNYVIKNGRRYGLLGTKNCKNVTEKLFK